MVIFGHENWAILFTLGKKFDLFALPRSYSKKIKNFFIYEL